MDDKALVSLLNPSFVFKFADKEYQIRKANIEQVQQYITKMKELSADKDLIPAVRDLEIVSFCLYLLLKKADQTVTEDFVKENLPGNIDGLVILGQLGFIDPQKVELLKKLQDQLISENSSYLLRSEPDGHPTKSESSPSNS